MLPLFVYLWIHLVVILIHEIDVYQICAVSEVARMNYWVSFVLL